MYPVEDPDLHPLPAVPSLGISMGGSKNPSRAHSAKNSRRASEATGGTAVVRADSDCALKMGKTDSANDSNCCSPKQELPSKGPDGAAAAIPQMGNTSGNSLDKLDDCVNKRINE